MIDENAIQHLLTDLRQRVDPETYDGTYGQSCLIGQLDAAIDPFFSHSSMSPTSRVGLHYDLPSVCIEAIYTTAARAPFNHNLDAALWLADYLLYTWTDAMAEQYLDDEITLEEAVIATFRARNGA